MNAKDLPDHIRELLIRSAEELIEKETRQRVALEEWIEAIDGRIAKANAEIEELQAG